MPPVTPAWQSDSLSFLQSQQPATSHTSFLSAFLEDSFQSLAAEPGSEPVPGEHFMRYAPSTGWRPTPELEDQRQDQALPAPKSRLNERIELVRHGA